MTTSASHSEVPFVQQRAQLELIHQEWADSSGIQAVDPDWDTLLIDATQDPEQGETLVGELRGYLALLALDSESRQPLATYEISRRAILDAIHEQTVKPGEDSLTILLDIATEAIAEDTEAKVTVLDEYRHSKEHFDRVSARLAKQVQQGDQEALQQLWVHALPFIERVIQGLPTDIPLEQGVQVVAIRLIKHIDRFDPSMGSFTTFMHPHIRGAIYDEYRSHFTSNGLKRGDFKVLQEIANDDADPSDTLHRLISQGFELAPHLIEDDRVVITTQGKGKPWLDPNGSHSMKARQHRNTNDETFEEVARNLQHIEIENLITRLPIDQQIVLRHLYGVGGAEKLTLAKIGQQLLGGATEARASQIHRAGLDNAYKIGKGESFEAKNRLRFAEKHMKGEDQLDYLDRVKQGLSRLKIPQLTEAELESFMGQFPAWSSHDISRDNQNYRALWRSIEDQTDLSPLTQGKTQRRAMGLKHSKLIMVVPEIEVSDLEVMVEVESTIEKAIIDGTPELNIKYDANQLSERQLEVFRRITKPVSQIAFELEISSSAVRSHLHKVMKAFGLKNQQQLALAAIESGEVNLRDIPTDRTSNLSQEELRLLTEYYSTSYGEAASATGLSLAAVKGQWHSIFTKMQAVDRTQAVIFAVADGLISLKDAA